MAIYSLGGLDPEQRWMGPEVTQLPPKAQSSPTQDAGMCEGALAGVEAVGAQVGRHHLLDQCL